MPHPIRRRALKGSKASTTVPTRFGNTGKPVLIPRAAVNKAKARGGRLYEDASVGGSGQLRGSKAAPSERSRDQFQFGGTSYGTAADAAAARRSTPKGSKAARPTGAQPNPRALERANPNASFKRAVPPPTTKDARPATPAKMVKRLPKPPPYRR